MPKKSKINSTSSKPLSSKPKKAEPLKDEPHEFYCSRCGRVYKRQKNNFPSSQSHLYRGNGGYLTVCNTCIDEIYEHYRDVFEDEADALRRMCLKFDIYWNKDVNESLNKSAIGQSRIRSYISRCNIYKYVGKTFDDTLDEECLQESSTEESDYYSTANSVIIDNQHTLDNNDYTEEPIPEINESIIKYWGTGFTPSMYLELEDRRDYWLKQYPTDTVLQPGEEALLRQICNLEITINHDRVAGKSIDKSVNTLNTLLGSMNIKPSQKKETEENYIPFGCEIAKFEEEHPIIEPDDDFKDVDGLRKNVISWFLGSLCKTSGIKNKYSKYFDEEVAKYTVERPQYDEEIIEDEEDNSDD